MVWKNAAVKLMFLSAFCCVVHHLEFIKKLFAFRESDQTTVKAQGYSPES